MANDLQSPPEANMTELLTGILNDAEKLFQQQWRMVRSEVQEDFRKTRDAMIPLAIGLWFVLLGTILLSITLALGLAAAGMSYWASFAVVGGAIFLVGGGLYFAGKKKFESFNPLPDESAAAIKENVEWLAKPK
jgi:hypothetical protein